MVETGFNLIFFLTACSESSTFPPYNPLLKICLNKVLPVSTPFKYNFPSASILSKVVLEGINCSFSSRISAYLLFIALLSPPYNISKLTLEFIQLYSEGGLLVTVSTI